VVRKKWRRQAVVAERGVLVVEQVDDGELFDED